MFTGVASFVRSLYASTIPPSLPSCLALDVSADVTELGRTPVAVVSAGIKSILDVGRTLEYLETEGVTVGNFGPSKDFPAFFSRKSGFQVSI